MPKFVILAAVILLLLCLSISSFAESLDTITPSNGSTLEVYRPSAYGNYILGLNPGSHTLADLKASLDNDAQQITAYKNSEQLSDSSLLGTGCLIKCVDVSTSAVLEQALIVLHGDVNGDGATDAFDAFYCDRFMNQNVFFSEIFMLAADVDADGEVGISDYVAIKANLQDGAAVSQTDFYSFYNIFTTVFEHTDTMLYRIGNGNTVKLGQLFRVNYAGDDAVVSANVNIKVEALNSSSSVCGSGTNLAADSTAKCVYTKNSSDWTQSTLKFTGEGPVRISISESTGEAYELLLEVVNANNATTSAAATSNNTVLLNDITLTGAFSISKVLYGNGFTVTDARSSTSGTEGFVNMSAGRLDNVNIVGQEYPTVVTSGNTNQYYSPCLKITGSSEIYNSHISGCRYAVLINGVNTVVYAYDSAFTGGTLASIKMEAGNLTLEDCFTGLTSEENGKKSFGINITSASARLTLKGTFNQYNWVTSSDMPSDYKSLFDELSSNSTFAYSYGGKTYVNAGIIFLADNTDFPTATAQAIVTDQTTNNYAYVSKTMLGHTGTLYAQRSASAAPSQLGAHEFVSDGQYYTIPNTAFDFTNKNYIAMSAESNRYCYYDSAIGGVNISFDEADGTFNWDTSILTVSKYGCDLDYTVTMNGVDYTGTSIPFAETGEYQVVYSYTDPNNYDCDGAASAHAYTKTVKIKVTVVEESAVSYPAKFTYIGNWSNSVKKVVINNKTYIMPDVSSTSTYITSTTVGGQTVYCPIVTATGKSGYETYCYCPAFTAINITDYNQDTGAAQYTYNSSAQKWPHNMSGSLDTNIYRYGSTHPFDGSSGDSGRSFVYNSSYGGLCFQSGGFSRDISEQTRLVEFHYVSNDGTTYYYYISYSISKVTRSGGCVADGTLVTMADGTKKAVENVKVGDMVRTWNFFEGCYENQPVVVNMYHGTHKWDVLTLKFSDGTEVRTMYEHGFYDADLNRNAYINTENVSDYLGDRFVKQGADGNNITVVLVDYSINTETAGAYTVLTAQNYNCMSNDMLSCCPEPMTGGLFEFFEIGDDMKYNAEQMQADIETYGVYAYEDLADGMTEEMFDAINAKYFKISALKYGFDKQNIIEIFNEYIYNPDNPLESY